jgi:hypothetical protein
VYAHLVYSAGKADVHMVIIDGRIQMEASELKVIEEEALFAEANLIGEGFV